MAQEQRKVSFLLGMGIAFIPYIFGWVLLSKGFSKKARVYGLTYTVLITLILIFREPDTLSPDSQPTANSEVKNVASIVKTEPLNDLNKGSYEGKIAPYALEPYTVKGGFEKTIKKYKSRLNEITKLRKQAAEKAIDSGKCDSVVSSELSDSSTLNHLNFWVECNNGERIYLDEFQLRNGSAVLTQQQLAISKSDAMISCANSIKSNVQFPSSVDIHHFTGTSFYEAPSTHNVRLEMDFDAKNGLGLELPFKAICTFQPGKEGSIEIIKR